MYMKSVFSTLLKELDSGRACELVTILSVAGTAPREPGCTMLVGENGRQLAGTVGGGSTEWQALKKASELLRVKGNGETVFTHGYRTEAGAMTCGADVTLRFTYCSDCDGSLIHPLKEALDADGGTLVLPPSGRGEFRADERPGSVFCDDTLFLYLPPADRVLLFGAGYVAQSLVPLLKPLGFTVTVFDERKDLADRLHFPEAHAVLTGSFSHDLPALTGAKNSDYIVIMSATHEQDEKILAQFCDRDYRYIGMLGSRNKATAIKDTLMKKGAPEARLSKVHIPIGLSIGACTPEEVALSVAAELVKTRAETRKNY